jgi:hypothetical protein
MGRLFEVRGPQKHQVGEERAIFEASRAIVALGHLVSRKRCFLESQEWKTVPWALEPGSKTMIMYLHDILCDLPGLMEDADLLYSLKMRPAFDAHHSLVSDGILSCLKELYEWRATWQQQNPNPCREVLSNDATTDPVLFPVVLQYPSLIEANSITLYNAILLLLIKLGFQVIGPHFNPAVCSLHLPQEIDYGPLIPPGLAPNPQALAIEICKGVEYHLCEERRRAGAFFLMFPLRVAWQAFDPGDPVAVWLEGVMKMIADSTGFEVSRGLSGNEGFQTVDRDESVLDI